MNKYAKERTPCQPGTADTQPGFMGTLLRGPTLCFQGAVYLSLAGRGEEHGGFPTVFIVQGPVAPENFRMSEMM
ncbi:unnamed protein product [Gadus morhua 'NCC']